MNGAWNHQDNVNTFCIGLDKLLVFWMTVMDKEAKIKHDERIGKSRKCNLGRWELSNKVRSDMSEESGRRKGLLYLLLAI